MVLVVPQKISAFFRDGLTNGREHSPFYWIATFMQFVWWLLLHPGLYSSDSIELLQRIQERDLSSEWTYLWDVSVFALTLGGRFPSLAVLAFGTILVNSLTYFCFSIFPRGIARCCVVLMLFVPILPFLSNTLWHDVPMTAGLFLFAGTVVRIVERKKINKVMLCAALVLINFRHNGIWTILLSLLPLFCFRVLGYRLFVYLSAIVVIVTAPFAIANSKFYRSDNVQISGITHWMKYDIACWMSKGESIDSKVKLGFEFDNELISESACNWFMEEEKLELWKKVSSKSISKNWLAIFREVPKEVFVIHNERSPYLVPKLSLVAKAPPFLHTNIEYTNPWVTPSNPVIYEIARVPGRAWNFAASFTAYSGLWWIVIGIGSILFKKLFPAFVIAGVLNISVYVSAIIPDARYTAFTIMSGNVVAIALLLHLINRIFLRRGQEGLNTKLVKKQNCIESQNP